MTHFLGIFALLVLVSPVMSSMEFGSGQFVIMPEKEFACKPFGFKNPFTADEAKNAHVQTAIFNNDNELTYEATVSWVEEITQNGFIACIETAGPVPVSRTVKLHWMSYTGSPDNGLAGSKGARLFTTGTECVDIDFIGKSFTSVPFVYVTAVHTSSYKNNHDAMSVWAEGATLFSFKACMRELKNFDGIHEDMKIDWLALEGVPNKWQAPFGTSIKLQNTDDLKESTRYSFCEDITFNEKFYAPPVLITSALHYYDSSNPNSIKPDHNAITEWIESVSNNNFRVCMKDIQPFDGHHDPVDIEYLALGDLDPCNNRKCDFFAECKSYAPDDGRCVCPEKCEDYKDMKCGSDNVTYGNQCELELEMCKQRKVIDVVHNGTCFPFILHRGRTQLALDTDVVQCKTVKYNSPDFLPQYKVYVQASINYYKYEPHYIHDAAVVWTENVNFHNFTACVLKAGRNDRQPPDNGLTYVDYIAYQGSPNGGVVGLKVLTNWWDGTTCETVTLPSGKFSSKPFVLASAQHGVVGQKHDAATTWVEDVTTTSFKLCLRELQNFDGLHQKVKVSWLAYETLPAEFSAERTRIAFPNDYTPGVNENNAFCKTFGFNKFYSSPPTVIITAAHTTSVGHLIPDHNSIAAWVEETKLEKKISRDNIN